MTLYQHQPQRQSGVAALFVVGYSIAAYFAYSTAGLPLAAALAEQARLDSLANATNATNAINATANLTARSAVPVSAPDAEAQRSSTVIDWEDEEVRRPRPTSTRWMLVVHAHTPDVRHRRLDAQVAEESELAELRAVDGTLSRSSANSTNSSNSTNSTRCVLHVDPAPCTAHDNGATRR